MFFKLSRLIGLAIILTFDAASASVLDLGSSSCSGVSTFDISDAANINCTGDFFIDGNSLTSEYSISISADGQLTLENLYLNAPSVNLYAGVAIALGSGTVIAASALFIGVNGVDSVFNIDQTASLIINSSAGQIILNSGEISQILANESDVQPINIGSIELAAVPIPESFVLFLSGLLPILIGAAVKIE